MTIGRAPQAGTGKGLIDADWLLGIAGGDNTNCHTVAASVGATQAGAPVVGATGGTPPTEAALIYVNSSVATGSLQLPQASPGREISVYNGTANTINIYANTSQNRANANALDTINGNTNATANQIAPNATAYYFCPVVGVWGQK